MTQPAKLCARLLSNPAQTLSFRDFERLLQAFGFENQRTRGSHRAYKHPKVAELLTVQPHGSEARRYQVRKFLAMVREFSLEMSE